MTDTRPALAHGEPIIVVAPEGVDRAISEVMGRHRAELDEALQPFGVALDDLVQATWMRFVRFGDVVPLGAAADDDRPAGGCCGSGEACSSAACTGTSPGISLAPGAIQINAPGYAVPTARAVAARFGRGGVRGDDE